MVLICAVAASFLAFMRMVERGATQDYLVFGACIGFGLISKWSFAAFCMALAAGALLQPALRARLLDWRILVSVGVAAIVAAPAIYWLVTGATTSSRSTTRPSPQMRRIGCGRP
jgi:4-amino-4-deoxy-L-arabinose transferase-like glycosyltransferase